LIEQDQRLIKLAVVSPDKIVKLSEGKIRRIQP